MNKELEALKRLLEHCKNTEDGYYECDVDIEDYELIKSALERKEQLETENAELKAKNEKLEKVWTICLKKEVNVADVRESIVSCDMSYGHYAYYQKDYSWELLTEEEYNLLKEEILKYEKAWRRISNE